MENNSDLLPGEILTFRQSSAIEGVIMIQFDEDEPVKIGTVTNTKKFVLDISVGGDITFTDNKGKNFKIYFESTKETNK